MKTAIGKHVYQKYSLFMMIMICVFLSPQNMFAAITDPEPIPYFDATFNKTFSGTKWFSLDLTAGQGITIALTANLSQGGLVFGIFDSGENKLTGSNDTAISNGETGVADIIIHQSGTYYIKVWQSSTAVGSYDLAVYNSWYNAGVTDGDRNFNGTLLTATYIHSGNYSVTDNGSVNDYGVYYHRFTVNANTLVNVAVTAHLSAGGLDFGIYDNYDELPGAGSNDTSITNGQTGSAGFRFVEPGVYYVRIWEASDATGSYDLVITGANGDADTDGDMLYDAAEYIHGTNIGNTDTDGDGTSDYTEIVNGRNPLIEPEYPASAISGAISMLSAFSIPFFDKRFNVEHPDTSATWYSFNLTAGQGVTVVLTAHLNKNRLRFGIYDADNVQLAFTDDSYISDGETGAASVKVVESGTYYIKVFEDGDAAGNYDLGVYNAWFNPGVEDAQRDYYSSYYTAKYIAAGNYPASRLTEFIDYYRFTVSANTTVEASVTAHLNKNRLRFGIYDADGVQLAFSNNAYISNGETGVASAAIIEPGTYYVKVWEDGDAVGNYDLAITGANGDADTDGDMLYDAAEYIHGTNIGNTDTDGDGTSDYTEIVNGRNPLIEPEYPASAVSGAISMVSAFSIPFVDKQFNVEHPGTSATWYSFNLTAGQGATVVLTAHLNKNRLRFGIYDAGNVQLAFSDDSYISSGETGAASVKVVESGTYYIKVFEDGDAAGNYDLGVYNAWFNPGVEDAQRDYYSSYYTAKYIAAGNYPASRLTEFIDYYRFTVSANTTVEASVTAHLNKNRLRFGIYDADGVQLAFTNNSYISNGETGVASAAIIEPGTYYVKVWEDGDAVGNYDLAITGHDGYNSFTINPAFAFIDPAGSSDNMVNVDTSDASFSWTAVSNNVWITVTDGSSGMGDGMVTYSVAANTGCTQRTGTITIADKTFTVTQNGNGCSFSIDSESKTFTAAHGTGSVAVDATLSCCTWTAISNDTWITLTGGTSGTGDGTVNYSVAENTGLSRTGTITIAGKIFTVNQDAGLRVSMPTFTPTPGTYLITQAVSLSCATSGATIYYTTNGSTPTSSSTIYSTPVPVSSTTTIKAIAAKSGLADSVVVSGTYTIDVKPAILKGKVVGKDAQGKILGPLSGATIQIPDVGVKDSNSNGMFSFENLTPGTYTVTISKTQYYALTKQIRIGSGDTNNDIYYLNAQGTDLPSVFNFESPQGNHFIEGMPGNLSFSTMIAWNGSPGTVRFLIAGQWVNASITDLGNGLARADLMIPAPGLIILCGELTIEVVNGEGEKNYIDSGIYFYPVPELIDKWFEENIPWLSGAAFTWSSEAQKPSSFIPEEMHMGPFRVDAYDKEKKTLRFDPLAGSFSGEIIRSLGAKFATGTPMSNVRFLGEIQGNAGGGLEIGLAGCQSPRLNPYWELGVSGKAGVGIPAVVFVELIVPPVAPAIQFLLGIPVVCKVVGSLETRYYLIFGLDFKGSYGLYPNIELGDKFFWAKKIDGTGTLGLEIQSVLELYKAHAGIYGGAKISLPTELPVSISKVRGYTGVFAGYKLFSYKIEYGVEFSFTEDKAKAVQFIPLNKEESFSWEPIGASLLKWGAPNRLLDAKVSGSSHTETLDEANSSGSIEQAILENVLTVATPSLISDANETVVAFTAYDENKPWYEATDIAEAISADGQAWSIQAVTDDLAAEFSPQIKVESQTSILGVWTQVYGDVSGVQAPGEIAPYEEIVASWKDRNTGLWGHSERITNNAQVDRDPKPIIFGTTKGIVWIQNEADLEMGNADKGDNLMFAPWNGSNWGSAQILWTGKKSILNFSFTADADDQGHIVFSVDEDGNPETTDDMELYQVSTVAGIWQEAVRLTNDAVQDSLPVLVSPGNNPMLIWKSGETVKYSFLSVWNPKDVYPEGKITADAPTLDGVTMAGGAAIAYAAQGPDGMDIMAAFYDSALDQWSLPRQLTHDEAAESSISMAFNGQELVMAYLKTQTVRTDMDIEINGQMQHIENVPQPGRTDLYVLRHTLGNDLSIDSESIVLTPENSAPGTAVEVRVKISNNGDLPVQNIPAAFYDGDPDNGGSLITQATIIGPVIAGDSVDVTISWNIPADYMARNLYVVIDPALTIDDRNRANNMASKWTSLPDMTVETSWNDQISSTTVALTADVVNAGVIPTGTFNISWRLNTADGPEIGKTAVESIIPGASNEVAFMWDVASPIQPGQFIPVCAVVDTENNVQELDETNNSGLQSVKIPMYTDQVGSLTVNIVPPEAAAAGVKWSPDGGTNWYDSGATVTLLSGTYTITFSEVNGWALPAIHDVTISTGQSTVTPYEADCTFTIDPESKTFTAIGGTDIVDVDASDNTCTWTAASNAAWITVTGGVSGTGDGTLDYAVAANTGAARTGTITIVGETFTVTQDAGFNLDIDNNGVVTPFTDGILILRYLLDYQQDGESWINGAVGANAQRSTSADIEAYLGAGLTLLDIDNNGAVTPFTDGILILRYLLDYQQDGPTWINGAVGANAQRSTAAEIEAYIASMIP